MRVLCTDDVPVEPLEEAGEDLGPEFEFEIEEGRMFSCRFSRRRGFN